MELDNDQLEMCLRRVSGLYILFSDFSGWVCWLSDRRVIVKRCRGSTGSKGPIFYFIFIKFIFRSSWNNFSHPCICKYLATAWHPCGPLFWSCQCCPQLVFPSSCQSQRHQNPSARSFRLMMMLSLLALTSVLTTAVLAQTTVGFFYIFFSSTLIILFSRLLQTPSFPMALVNLAPRSWKHLIRIPHSLAALLRWRMSPLNLPQAPQPLHLQTLRLLCPISAPVQWQARVPSLSFAHRSRISTVHAPTSWQPNPFNLFAICMRSCTHCSRFNSPFAQRTTRAIIVLKGPVRSLVTSMRTTRFPFLKYWVSFTSSQTMVPSHAEMKPPYPTWVQLPKATLCSSTSHPISAKNNCVLYAFARLCRPTLISCRTFRLHMERTTAYS